MENRESLWKKDFHSKLRRYRISWWLKREPGWKACILEMQIWEIVHVNRGSIIKHEVPLKRRENGFTATGSFIINFHSVFLFAARITVPAKSLEARNARRRDSFRENGSSFASIAINRCEQIRCTYLIDRFIGKTTMLWNEARMQSNYKISNKIIIHGEQF